jgi:mono/diheme cytochrome c family protein
MRFSFAESTRTSTLADVAMNLPPQTTTMSQHALRRMGCSAVPVLALLLIGCGGGDTKAASQTDATVASGAASAAAVPVAKPGETTFGQICQSCHQATGLGVEGTFPPLKGSKWLLGNPDVPISIVIAGLQGEISVDGKPFNGAMQPWGMLSDDDVANVLTYARAQWGNAAGAVTPAQVKTVRDKIGNRGTWTADELKKAYPGAGA